MDRIRQNMNGYRMPAYIEEILTQNYCGSFMRMSIVSENGRYSFSYKPENYKRINPSEMSLYDKLLLIRNLISMAEDSDDHLISADNYLLEPELIYARGSNIDTESLRIMFYPDAKRLGLIYKIVLFADRILGSGRREEREMAGLIREAAEPGDLNRIKLFLEKNIVRIENRMDDARAGSRPRS